MKEMTIFRLGDILYWVCSDKSVQGQ